MIRLKLFSCALCVAVVLLASQGIPAVRLPFIRPLITVSRPAIYSYLQSEHCPWVEDSSNTHTVYLRNRVRLDLLPKLQQYNPQIVRRLNELADMLRADSQVLEQQVDEWALQTLAWQARSRVEICVDSLVLLLSLSSDVFCAVLLKH